VNAGPTRRSTTSKGRWCALQQTWQLDFRCGSKADVTLLNLDVRYTLESGANGLFGNGRNHILTPARVSVFDDDVPIYYPAKLLQGLFKRFVQGISARSHRQIADVGNLACLLRFSRRRLDEARRASMLGD
jgi:hypothetical protein